MKHRKNDDEERTCSFCRYSSAVCGREEMLCRRKGIVPREFSCRAFIYDPLKRVPRRAPAIDLPELPQV